MSFDRLAPHYRRMEAVLAGKILQRARTAFLAETKSCRRALLLGEGPGRFLIELLKTNPQIQVHCVERSAGMILEAKRELSQNGLSEAPVTFEEKDALTWKGRAGANDLIVTNFFLDCFTRAELQRLIPEIAASATEGARWLLADFRLPERGWTRWRAGIVLALMYRFFRVATDLSASQLTPPDEFLVAAGFERAQQRLWNFGLVRSDLWMRQEALRDG